MRKLLCPLLFSLTATASGCLPPAAPQPLYSEIERPRVMVTQTHIVLNEAIFFE